MLPEGVPGYLLTEHMSFKLSSPSLSSNHITQKQHASCTEGETKQKGL